MKATEQGQCYRDFQGRVLYVGCGISNGTTWMTLYEKPNGSQRRFKSKFLPLRETREQAQKDLDRLAEERGMSEVQND